MRPTSCAFSMISCGHVASRSYSHATDRISFSAKLCASSRRSFCSSVRVRSTTWRSPCEERVDGSRAMRPARLIGESTSYRRGTRLAHVAPFLRLPMPHLPRGLRHRDLDRRAGGRARRGDPVRRRLRPAGPARPRGAVRGRAPAPPRPARRTALPRGPSGRTTSASSCRPAATGGVARGETDARRGRRGGAPDGARPRAAARGRPAGRGAAGGGAPARDRAQRAAGGARRSRRSTSRRRSTVSCATWPDYARPRMGYNGAHGRQPPPRGHRHPARASTSIRRPRS